MNHDISRRTALKWTTAAAGTAAGLAGHPDLLSAADDKKAVDNWSQTHDRVWLGGNFWANPMEDWRVNDGAAECLNLAGNRSVHSVTRQITKPSGGFAMSVKMKLIETKGKDGGGGFRIGVRSELNEYRSNCFVTKGINAGIAADQLILANKTAPITAKTDLTNGVDLHLSGAADGDQVTLTLTAKSPDSGATVGEISHKVSADDLLGNVSLVSNYTGGTKGKKRNKGKAKGNPAPSGSSRHAFSNWTLDGDAFTVSPEQRFGPILWSMYSLSDSRSEEGFVMKISAVTGPLGKDDN